MSKQTAGFSPTVRCASPFMGATIYTQGGLRVNRDTAEKLRIFLQKRLARLEAFI
jgi:hypothetical protein